MTKATLFLATTVVLACASIALPAARQGGAPAATLTARDYLEIQQLVTRFAYALDMRAENGYAFADLFASDGEFVGVRGSAKGRDALAALARAGIMQADQPIVGVSHFNMNHVVEPAGGGAIGKEYLVMVAIAEGGKPGGEFSNTGGHYEDAYVKTPAGWRFKRREYVPIASNARPQGERAR